MTLIDFYVLIDIFKFMTTETEACSLDEILAIKQILKTKQIHITAKEIAKKLKHIDDCQLFFPHLNQRALLVQLLYLHKTTNRHEIIILEELGENRAPAVIILGVLAEDWAGMSNTILGIIHQREGNVQFLKGLTIKIDHKNIGIVFLAFIIETQDEYDRFLLEKSNLANIIKKSARGSKGKTLLLEDEIIKLEIYSQTIEEIKRIYKKKDIANLIGEKGETLKFFSSRSREYLEERKISDLARFILTNYMFHRDVSQGKAEVRIRIENFKTLYEHLTGITFCCKEVHFSIESFLKTLEFIVPGHVIKHHKSFVTSDRILLYRIEIVDNNGEPLNPEMIRSIEMSLQKLIFTTANETFFQIKSIGGFEHYARAIIPFLMKEVANTKLPQVYISADKKNEFLMSIRLLVVATKNKKDLQQLLIKYLENINGIEIYSVIPTKTYGKQINVNRLNLRVDLSAFTSINEIFNSIKDQLKKIYGAIRDFDEGLRDSDLNALNTLIEKCKPISSHLTKEIFFNFDEIYRIETPTWIIADIVRLCFITIGLAGKELRRQIVITFCNIKHPERDFYSKTIFIISYVLKKSILTAFLKNIKGIGIHFTRIEWNQRNYLIAILEKNNSALNPEDIELIKSGINKMKLKHIVFYEADH